LRLKKNLVSWDQGSKKKVSFNKRGGGCMKVQGRWPYKTKTRWEEVALKRGKGGGNNELFVWGGTNLKNGGKMKRAKRGNWRILME